MGTHSVDGLVGRQFLAKKLFRAWEVLISLTVLRQIEGSSERTYILGGNKMFPTLKVRRQCSIVFLVETRLRQDKALGSEEGKRVTK